MTSPHPGLWQWCSITREPLTWVLFEMYVFFEIFIPSFSLERNLLPNEVPWSIWWGSLSTQRPMTVSLCCSCAQLGHSTVCVWLVFTIRTSPQFNLTFSICDPKCKCCPGAFPLPVPVILTCPKSGMRFTGRCLFEPLSPSLFLPLNRIVPPYLLYRHG